MPSSSTNKINLNTVTLYDLHRADQQMTTRMRQITAKDPVTKIIVDTDPLVELLSYYIPTKAEMSFSGGQYNLKNWGISHFLFTADYLVAKGYPRGILPSWETFCEHQGIAQKVQINARGETVDIDDPRVINMVEGLLDIPPKMYKEIGRMFTEIVTDTVTGKVTFDAKEPFALLLWYQQNVTFQIAIRAISGGHFLEAKLGEISRTPISSRVEVDELADTAETVLALREISTLSVKGAHDVTFFHNVMSFLTAKKSGVQTGGDRVKLIGACEDIRKRLSAGEFFTLKAFFAYLKEQFETIEEADTDPIQSALVANTASRPFSSNRKENVSPQSTGTTTAKSDVQQMFLNIKAELGAIRAQLARVLPEPKDDGRVRTRRTQEEPAKKGKQYAAIAKVKKGAKPPKKNPGGNTLPRSFVQSSDSSESEDDDREETAMFASIPQPRNLESILGPFRRTVVPPAKALQAETNMIDFYSLPPSQVLPEMIEDSGKLSRAMTALDPCHRWTDGLTESRYRRTYPSVYLDDKPWYNEQIEIPLPKLQQEEIDSEGPPSLATTSDDASTPPKAKQNLLNFPTLASYPGTRHKTVMASLNYPDATLPSDDDADVTVVSVQTSGAEPSEDQDVHESPPQPPLKKGALKRRITTTATTKTVTRPSTSGVMSPKQDYRATAPTRRSDRNRITTPHAPPVDDPSGDIGPPSPKTTNTNTSRGDVPGALAGQGK